MIKKTNLVNLVCERPLKVVPRYDLKDAVLRRPGLQGQPTQTGFFKLARRDRNMKLKFFWKVISKS